MPEVVFSMAQLDIILQWEICFCDLQRHTDGSHQGMKSNFVKGNLMPSPLYNDWRKLIIANNIPLSATQERFNRIFIIHVSWYTSATLFCNISEINSISSLCRLSTRLPAPRFISQTNTFSKQMERRKKMGKEMTENIYNVPMNRSAAWRWDKSHLMCAAIRERIIINKRQRVYYWGCAIFTSYNSLLVCSQFKTLFLFTEPTTLSLVLLKHLCQTNQKICT